MTASPCPLCGGQGGKTRLTQHVPELGRALTVAACDGCGAWFTSRRPSGEELANLYGGGYGEWRGPAAPLLRMVRRWVGAQKVRMMYWEGARRRLLDIGCGRGWDSEAFRARGWRVTGYEVAEESARAARSRGFEVASGPTLASAALPEASFDAALMWHVLEHLEDPRAALREVARLLVPAGVLLVSVPNARSLLARLLGASWGGWDLGRHTVHFTRERLEAVLRECGFQVVRRYSYALEPDGPGVVQALYDLLGFRHSFYFYLTGKGGGRWRTWLPMLATAVLGVALVPVGLLAGAIKALLFEEGETVTLLCRKAIPV